MHPRIARIYVHNYRCFANFELRPDRRRLLVGYNGTGKSSLFDVIESLRMLLISNSDAKVAFPTNALSKFGGSNEQRFELDLEADRGLLHYALHLEHDLQTETPTIFAEELLVDGRPLFRFAHGEVQLYTEASSPAGGAFPFTRHRSFLASLEPKDPTSLISVFKNFLTYCWNMRLDPAHIPALASDEQMFLTRDGKNFAAFCRQLLQDAPQEMQSANEILREIIPGFVQLRTQPAGRAKVLVATFRYPGGNTYDIDFDALSDGQKTLMVLYVVLRSVARQIPAICLDEPDNYVSLREIQPFLTELADVSDDTGLQVLLISHSPEVINYIGTSGSLLLERPDGGHTRVGTLPKIGSLPFSELMARGWLSGGTDGTE